MLTRLLEQVVRCLLIEPNPESALNEEAGELSVVCMYACMHVSARRRAGFLQIDASRCTSQS